jgi:predicted CoA-binding protein
MGDARALNGAIKKILRQSRTVAVVGVSSRKERDSHRVAMYLKNAGYDVIPVNPVHTEVEGMTSHPDVESVPGPVDIVDIFRRSEFVDPVVESAIRKHARVIWMQEGVVNQEAARKAEAAGLQVVMDRCIMKEHRKLAAMEAED